MYEHTMPAAELAAPASSAGRHDASHQPAPTLQGDEFNRLSAELDDASSLLTDASCAMTIGWTGRDLARCSAMLAGAQALIDHARRRLADADAAYVRALEGRNRVEAQP